MSFARVLEHRIPIIAGRLQAAQTNFAILASILGDLDTEEHAQAVMALGRITNTIMNLQALLAHLLLRWEIHRDVILAGDIDTMMRLYSSESNGLIVAHDGLIITSRTPDVQHISNAIAQIMSEPEVDDRTVQIVTALGFKTATIGQLQGLLAANLPIDQASCRAMQAVLAEHESVPFTSWADIKDYYDQKFGEFYAG